MANGTWSVDVNSGYGNDNNLPGNYLAPGNQTVVISNDNGTANFTALLLTRRSFVESINAAHFARIKYPKAQSKYKL